MEKNQPQEGRLQENQNQESQNKDQAKFAESKKQGISASAKILILVAVIIAIGVALLFWKKTVIKHEDFKVPTKLTEQDFLVLLHGEDPSFLKRLSENPLTRQKLLESLKQNLAIASQAQKEGFDKEEDVKEVLKQIAVEATALQYDREINKDKGPMPAFGFIEQDKIDAFYSDPINQAAFEEHLQKNLERLKKQGRYPKDREPSADEIEQAKAHFARIKISEKEYKDRQGELSEDLKRKIELQVKLQQSNYLAIEFSRRVLSKRFVVTDAEIEKYLKEHPELDKRAEKRAKAEEILNRVMAGEDFTELARQFSEDPGSKDKGGLYENIRKGSFVPEFEAVALSLEPGQIAPQIVETQFGYHIIKLEKLDYIANRDSTETPIYNVRHILLSTSVTDPENPLSGSMPLKEYVRGKLQDEKRQKILEEVLENNPIELPEDFPVPEISEEDLKKLEEMDKIREEELRKLREANPEARPKKEDKSQKSKPDKKQK
jgi:parvulin-like peptidyl-prolyl isomerase